MAPEKKSLPTTPSTKKFALPQSGKPAASLPPWTEDLCPTCHAAGILRRVVGETRVFDADKTEHVVRHCRPGHHWSRSERGLELYRMAREKRRAARRVKATIPPATPGAIPSVSVLHAPLAGMPVEKPDHA